MMGIVMRCAAIDAQDVIVPDCGHWVMEEQPAAVTKLIVDFLK
jgi:pimeloyl-ACP methyl ester carboxylesterase